MITEESVRLSSSILYSNMPTDTKLKELYNRVYKSELDVTFKSFSEVLDSWCKCSNIRTTRALYAVFQECKANIRIYYINLYYCMLEFKENHFHEIRDLL